MSFPGPLPNNKPTLLITGASGLLGDALCRLAVERWSVYGSFLHHGIEIPGVQPVQVDLTDDAALTKMLSDIEPHAVVHAAAESQVAACESYPRRTRRINVDVPARLAEICAEQDIDYLFTSTDLVFDGRHAPYAESARSTPICEYARQKASAERAVLKHHSRALICRLPLMFGLAPYATRHFTVQLLTAILSNQPVTLLVDEFRTPVDTVSAATGILGLLGKTSGLLHLGGRTRLSRYDMGLLMASQLNRAPTMLRPATIEDLRLAVPRAPDCALVSDAAYSLGYNPLSLASAIESVALHFQEKQKNA